MKIYYINLDRSKNRNDFMVKTHKGKNITRISAYDGKKIDSYKNEFILPEKCYQNNYQLGCSLSHIKAIAQSYNNGDKEALIMEDDMDDKYSNKWEETIETIIKNKPDDADCVSLYCNNINRVKSMIGNKKKYEKWQRLNWSTGCYYINRNGMKKIYDKFIKNNIIDLSIKLINYVADEGVIYKNLNTYSYTKPLFINELFSSTIMVKSNLNTRIHNFTKSYFEKRYITRPKPVIKKPVVRKPPARKPPIRKPHIRKPITWNNIASKPIARKPIARKPIVRKPIARKPIVKKPIVRKPIARKPIARKPIVRKPIARKPIARKPIVKKPIVIKNTDNQVTTFSGSSTLYIN